MTRARRAATPLALFLSAAALLALAAGTPAGAVPIRDLHVNSTSGVPLAPYGVGTTVSVTGVIVSPDNTFSLTSDEVVIRDTTGANLATPVACSNW